METLSSLLLGKPFNILAVAALFGVGYLLMQRTDIGSGRHPRALLVVAGAWALYAAWEWLVQVRTPEANIRADLLVIWPVILVFTIWFAVRAFR